MSASAGTVHLGYEIGSGAAFAVPMLNLAITGQTQESGKTTTLEALATRSGARVLTFVTKRGEGSFANGRRIQPYFHERADWQFVDALIEAALNEKNKYLRQFLIPICRTTQTLKEVQDAIRKGLKKASGNKYGAFVQLDAYLDLIVPDIARARLAPALDLQPGLNVMDVSDFSTPMQMLFVQSALDWINERERNTVVVIPEAWEFIPEGKGSPVKSSAVTLVRKGSGIGNHIWVDSQDMAGVDKTILRGCPVWLIGVQREINEVKRNIANIPPPTGKPKPSDVQMLERGQFFACFGKTLAKVYVQPAWMDNATAFAVATGDQAVPAPPRSKADRFADKAIEQFSTPLDPIKYPQFAPREIEAVTPKEADALRARNAELEQQVRDLTARLNALAETVPELGRAEGPRSAQPRGYPFDHEPITASDQIDGFASWPAIKRIILADADVLAAIAKIAQSRAEIEVTITRPVIKMDAAKQPGFLASMIVEKWFDSPRSVTDVAIELKRRGRSVHNANVARDLNNLAGDGFLTVEESGYQAVAGMKTRIIEQ